LISVPIDCSAISYNSCRNRHCPKCQAQARERWLTARQRELLPLTYFHVVFTVPHQLNPLYRDNARLLYDLLFKTVSETMLEVAAYPKHLGARIGFLAILHTWGQNLLLHPHLHCVVPAGELSLDRKRWISPRYAFFLPVKVLGRVFRGKFVAGLSGRFAATGCTSEAVTNRLRIRRHSPLSFVLCSGRIGSSTRNQRSAARPRCFAIWAGTPIVSPSVITGCLPSMANACRFDGKIMRTATSNGS
jgi:hypothetical protein